MATNTNYRVPDPLRTGSNVADDWRRFREQYEYYEIASDIADKSQEKRAAVFLICIGNDAYDVVRAMEFRTPRTVRSSTRSSRRLNISA